MDAVVWPKVFVDPDEVTYSDGIKGKKEALANMLSGWSCCIIAGLKGSSGLPEKFGKGAVKIAHILKINPTPDNLDKLYDQYKKYGII